MILTTTIQPDLDDTGVNQTSGDVRVDTRESGHFLKEKEEERGEIEFRQVNHDPYNLSYACLLIPRFSNHMLVGDIFSYLQIWMQQICISYDWQLDYIDVQPEYLQWVMSVPMTCSPARFIRIIKQFTSEQIFVEFPRFNRENISKEFWANGNLILVGKRPHPEPMIKEFIHITRRQQGISLWDQ